MEVGAELVQHSEVLRSLHDDELTGSATVALLASELELWAAGVHHCESLEDAMQAVKVRN